jgi:hypothetical protein
MELYLACRAVCDATLARVGAGAKALAALQVDASIRIDEKDEKNFIVVDLMCQKVLEAKTMSLFGDLSPHRRHRRVHERTSTTATGQTSAINRP